MSSARSKRRHERAFLQQAFQAPSDSEGGDVDIAVSDISSVASDIELNQNYEESLPEDSNKDIESNSADEGTLSDSSDASSDLGAVSDGGYTEIEGVLDNPNNRLFLRTLQWAERVSREDYNQLRQILRESGREDLPCLRRAQKRLRNMTQLNSRDIDCCVNSCMAYTGELADLERCKYCGESRFGINSRRPRRTFVYIPLIPRLLAQYRSKQRAQLLQSYPRSLGRDSYYDVWSGKLIQSIKQKGFLTTYTDIALQLSLDGMQLVSPRFQHEATPIALFNLNLPPEQRIKRYNVLTSLIIPGPKKYRDLDSFLLPLVEELEELGTDEGVAAWDASTGRAFRLRACVVIVTGDGPAIAEAMGLKRPGNAISPCRTCKIQAKQADNKNYYVPHLGGPLRIAQREDLRADIEDAMLAGKEEQQKLGIQRRSILLRLRSIHFPRSFPVDVMHCILLNVARSLFRMWMGERLPSEGSDNTSNYLLGEHSKAAISIAILSARREYPSTLGNAPRDPVNHYKAFKAAEWKAFLQYWGPPILAEHISADAYENLLTLSKLFILVSQHVISKEAVTKIRRLSLQFIEQYEKIYYKQLRHRLPVCTVNIHYIQHLAEYIKDCGPACDWWQFPLERLLGQIKPFARLKSQLDKSLANKVLQKEHLNLLQLFDQAEAEAGGENLDQNWPKYINTIKPPPTLNNLHLRKLRDSIGPLINAKRLKELLSQAQFYKRCQPRSGPIYGSLASQRLCELNRNDSRICYRYHGQLRYAIVSYFVRISQSCGYAYVQDFKVEQGKNQGVLAATNPAGGGRYRFVDVNDIICPVGIIVEQDQADARRKTYLVVGTLHLSI